ncbi:FliC/FljB family flagellin [Klebsiella aerogenes]|uniref:FliC/FljB family flagellin n=1 Tax=Klebsiella aerogenes TaxID=548 RepID=UPI000F7D5C50|nr:FliC/FljB family flagellin [Klebsiella aerogenes]RSV95146.1 FliC/FljB family flagellin [Klebsiella aerogenes]RSW77514.1 FliC/FljB family flagellin [Klebsiella aerogenes]HBR7307150.1 FliC/FljB family flagellin [Klebsiella aerogenes]HBS6042236.1 FliC/FljB family flagellin [Klebsiella aerogenes]HEO1573731.1 FliC/FljB family flagellin [Klebsiella aerogenes]
MAQVINTNSLSLMAQNNLNKSQSSLGTAIERLSSGLRINSAKDDAAGQAISNRFTANIKGLTQASRNANDGISLAQTTEGALNEVNDNLQNIRRLTVQSQNGSNSASDLQSIQDEISQRLSEINRISEQTDFNGVKVLSGDQKLTIQVGANDGETIDIDLKDINAKTLGLEKFSVADGIDTTKIDGDTTTVATGKSLAIDANSKKIGATPADPDHFVQAKDGKIYGTNAAGSETYEATIDKTTGKVTGFSTSDSGAVTGLTGAKTVTTVGEEVTATGDTTGLKSYDGGKSYIIQEGTGADAKYFKATADSTGKVTKGAEMSTTPKTADPLATLDKALSQVDQLRSSLGAVQNRFDSVINNLNSTVNNLSASQSRIQDADYATEVSNMSRANILQQAGTSVLAQANQSTQNVLSLLR